MVIGIIGESCSGKSTLAECIKKEIEEEIITGNDYLRMAKSESEARKLFQEKLKRAIRGKKIIYVISEPEQLTLLPEGSIRIRVCTDLDTMKNRFRERMHGDLPLSVEKMLEQKHGMFDAVSCDYQFDGAAGDTEALCRKLRERLSLYPCSQEE